MDIRGVKVTLQPAGLSINFGVRKFILYEGELVRFGRIKYGEEERDDNGLFNTAVVSTTHAILSFIGGKCLLEDKSRNGTFLNGLKMKPTVPYEIVNGDIIELGMASFILSVKVPGVLIDIKLSIIELPPIRLTIPSFHEMKEQDIALQAPAKDLTERSDREGANSKEMVKCTGKCAIAFPTSLDSSNNCSIHSIRNVRSKSIMGSSVSSNQVNNNVSSPLDVHKSACLDQLSMYFERPTLEYNLEDIFKDTLDRYHLLEIVAESTGDHNELSDISSCINIFQKKLKDGNISRFYDLISECRLDENLLLMDQVSHFCLRLACSRSFEALKWFVRQETKLLCVKWELATPDMRKKFLSRYKFTFNEISASQLKDIFCDNSLVNEDYVNGKIMHKVRFEEVPNLVRNRSVPIIGGWAILAEHQLIFAVANHYSCYLRSSLEFAKKWQSMVPYDPRLTPFFNKISECIRKKFCNSSVMATDSAKLYEIEKLSRESFPLCMEILFYNLQKSNHLRNGGRFQLNLFLKGIGLSLNDVIIFWSRYFLKKITPQEFSRHYLYHIRHGFGKLGKHADYPPLSCSKIMEAVPGPLEHHGCPFATSHKNILMNHLNRNSVSSEFKQEIWNLVHQRLPQTACGRFFDFKHKLSSHSLPTDHPNIYYNRSRGIRRRIQITDNPDVAVQKVSTHCKCDDKKVEW